LKLPLPSSESILIISPINAPYFNGLMLLDDGCLITTGGARLTDCCSIQSCDGNRVAMGDFHLYWVFDMTHGRLPKHSLPTE